MYGTSGNSVTLDEILNPNKYRGITSGAGQNMSLIGSGPPAATGIGSNMFNNGEGIFGNLLSRKGADGITYGGWGGTALGLGQGIMQGYQGMKQFGLAKDQLKEGRRQYEQNYAAQKKMTNSALEDRQRARVASNEGAYQSVSEYMNKHGIK